MTGTERGAAQAPAGRAVLERAAFSVDGATVRWRDVVADARARGTWARLEAETLQGIACLGADRAAGRAAPPDVVRAHAARWRVGKRLTAAEDMEAWLRRWDVSRASFFDHVRRSIARGAHDGDAADLARAHPPPSASARAAAVWATAACSGALQRAAERLADGLAVRARLSQDRGTVPDGDVEDALAELRDNVLTPAALDDELRMHRLDWVCLEGEAVIFASESAAREGRLCLSDDGVAPAELAAATGAALRHERLYLEEAPREALGAQPGEVVGPLQMAGGEWGVLAVRFRRLPSLADPHLCRRAQDAVVARAVRKERDDRVIWHD